MTRYKQTSLRAFTTTLCMAVVMWFGVVAIADAATLSLSPSTGVYQSGSTFTVRVAVNTNSQAVNAADATLSFNPRELSVVSVSRASSIFSLWVTEPTFSNSAGTISFSGGSPAGYTGSGGTVMSITFRVIGSGAARVNYSSGSVLANDGKGTNVLTTMNGGSYTLQTASAAPEPEVIEYVAPANTPGAPVITSSTHSDASAWHKNKTATLSWSVPAGVTEVRTLLDTNPSSVPTRVYESPISTITLSDLEEGESYFHLQFRNADGWGRIAHYRLAVDTVAPSAFTISQPEGTDTTNPVQTLELNVTDESSAVKRFMVRVDSSEPYEYILENDASSTITLAALEPGYHTVIIEAFDGAQNSTVASYSFTILAFDRPTFTEYPAEINEQVIPVLKGTTRPSSEVTVTLQRIGSDAKSVTVTSDAAGQFIFIPEGRLSQGVYEVFAVATDQYGAMSEQSDTVRIAVQQPGFIRVGTLLVSIASVVVPLVALVVLSVIGFFFMLRNLRRFRTSVTKESGEAMSIMEREFASLKKAISEQEAALIASRKTGKLTVAEADMLAALTTALQASRQAVKKELEDVTNLTK